MVVGAVLVLALTWQALSMRVAYVALGPGPTVDALGEFTYQDDTYDVISANPDVSSVSEGQLRLVTVRIYDGINLGQALYYWLSGDYAVIPREFQYPDDKSDEEIAAEQKKMWVTSQSAAETAALRELGHAVSVTVTEVEDASPNGDLSDGDVITEVEGEDVTSGQRLLELIAEADAAEPGEPVVATVDRDGETEDVKLTLERAADGSVTIPGVEIEPVQEDPYDLTVTTEGLGIGGPSAGLVFALAMIDRVDPTDLTGGLIIAGTGEIDEEGNVGPIGGVAQKVVGARADGATVFLTPSANCPTAAANAPEGLLLVTVDTLDDALTALETLRDGGQPPTC